MIRSRSGVKIKLQIQKSKKLYFFRKLKSKGKNVEIRTFTPSLIRRGQKKIIHLINKKVVISPIQEFWRPKTPA